MKSNHPKIVHLALGKANPNRMNGVNHVVHQLCTLMTDRDIPTELWGITKDPTHNYPRRNFKTILFQDKGLILDKKLVASIKAEKRTVFHLHGAFIPQFFQIAMLLHKCQLPFLYTPHGAFHDEAMKKGGFKKWLYFNTIEKSILHKAGIVHLLGEISYNNIARKLPTANKILIPNGINLAGIPYQHRTSQRPLNFVFLGRLATRHKGLDLLIEGFARYKKEGGEGRLTFIGDSSEKTKLQELTQRLAVDGDCHFLGAKYGDEKFSFLSQGDVFVHTSRMEGFPMAVLEAAAMGLPSIVSKATNIAGYISKYDAGISLVQNNPLEIAKAMHLCSEFHQQNNLSFLGGNARRMVEEIFEWDRVISRIIKQYTLLDSTKEDNRIPLNSFRNEK